MIWHPESWKSKVITQIPNYTEEEEHSVKNRLMSANPIVNVEQVLSLKAKLLEVSDRKAFVLQMGDCAETICNFSARNLISQRRLIHSISDQLQDILKLKVVSVGRIAGQYAKPRTHEFEIINGVSIPSYKGDMVNNLNLSLEERTPSISNMLDGYQCAFLSSKYISSYNESKNHDMYLSHEALLLQYETCFTKQTSDNYWYNLSTHLPWVGVRTAFSNSAHLEYCRGIENPIAIKIYDQHTLDDFQRIIKLINPMNEVNRLIFIHRFGVEKIAFFLPKLLEFVDKNKLKLIWLCDPMHGNTRYDAYGRKYRILSDILKELELAFKIHKEWGSFLGGVHLESTYEAVEECCNTASEANKESRAYTSLMDPRLNQAQTETLINFIKVIM